MLVRPADDVCSSRGAIISRYFAAALAAVDLLCGGRGWCGPRCCGVCGGVDAGIVVGVCGAFLARGRDTKMELHKERERSESVCVCVARPLSAMPQMTIDQIRANADEQ